MGAKVGAGIIIISFDGAIPKILGLIGDEKHQKKHGKTYDLPKGRVDPNESNWQAAVRETFEETGILIDQFDLLDGPINDSWLTMWSAEVPWGTPVTIGKNPNSGELEHDGYKWLEYNDIINNCYTYLQPFVDWAYKNI
tara:strand:- start:143 stop:559 length:417 start_codon:yes stop_codon:yes gene_type:complete